MYSSFEKLPVEKRELILRSSLEEFTAKGYYEASTDAITRNAGISKGILFHYFKSKKGLYLYLVEHIYDWLYDMVVHEIEKLTEDDFFQRIKGIMRVKCEVTLKYPVETEFTLKAIFNPPAEAAGEIAALYAKYWARYEEKATQDLVYNRKLLENVPLRIAPEKVIKVSSFILEQASTSFFEKYKERFIREGFEALMQEFALFIEELDFFNDVIKYGVISR